METVTLAPHLAAELVAPSDVAAQTDVAGVKAAVPDSVEQVCCWIHAAGISFANHNPNQHRLTFNAFPVIRELVWRVGEQRVLEVFRHRSANG